MNKKDKKLQKHLVDEMMKVYETNPDVMLYMQSLMENYEQLEQENKQLKKIIDKAIEYIKGHFQDETSMTFKIIDDISATANDKLLDELLSILGDDKK